MQSSSETQCRLEDDRQTTFFPPPKPLVLFLCVHSFLFFFHYPFATSCLVAQRGALLLAGENRRGKGVGLRLILSHGRDGKTTAVGELTSTPAANCRDHSSRRQLGRKLYFNWRKCVFLGFLDVFKGKKNKNCYIAYGPH